MVWHGQEALHAVVHHPLFGVGITLGVYQMAQAAYERTRSMFLQPVLVSMIVVIGLLLLAGLSYDMKSIATAPLCSRCCWGRPR